MCENVVLCGVREEERERGEERREMRRGSKSKLKIEDILELT